MEYVGIKRKRQRKKNVYTTQRNKPESTGERRKIEKMSRQGKIIQTKQDIPKEQKEKFYQQVGEEGTKTCQQPDAREAKQFWINIWEPGEHKKC